MECGDKSLSTATEYICLKFVADAPKARRKRQAETVCLKTLL